MARRDQPVAQVTAEEAGAPGHKNPFQSEIYPSEAQTSRQLIVKVLAWMFGTNNNLRHHD
jgi:hypothetical protein